MFVCLFKLRKACPSLRQTFWSGCFSVFLVFSLQSFIARSGSLCSSPGSRGIHATAVCCKVNTPNAFSQWDWWVDPQILILCVTVALLPRPESCCPRPSGERRQTYNLRASPRASSHRSPQRMALPAHQWVEQPTKLEKLTQHHLRQGCQTQIHSGAKIDIYWRRKK